MGCPVWGTGGESVWRNYEIYGTESFTWERSWGEEGVPGEGNSMNRSRKQPGQSTGEKAPEA